jgi:replicative DNA helicase
MIDERKLQERGLPKSIHAEMTTLGGMLVDSVAVLDATRILDPNDFSLDSHRHIYRAMLALLDARGAIDIVTVVEELRKKKLLDSVGGVTYLASLSEGLPRKLSIESYVRIIRQKSRLRGAAVVHQRGFDDSLDEGSDPLQVIERSIEDLRSLADDSDETELQSVGDYFKAQGEPEQMFEVMATVNGINLGFAQWDELTGGLQPGDLCIIAARPSMGKTAWMCNAARNTAMAGKITAIFSLEQPRQSIIRRMLSSAARVDYKDIRTNNLRRQDRTLLLEHRAILSQLPLYIDDQHGLTVTRIKSRAHRLKANVGLDIGFLDQLSHVSGADVYQKGMQLREVVGQQTKALKRAGKELGIPWVVFNQLSREAGKGASVIPILANLKESGNIEEDADLVGLLHRPEYYDKSDASLHGKAQMILAKNREGETKTIDCTYQGRILRWEDDYEIPAAQESFHGDYRAAW